MKTGTKSLLFGVHQVAWHPITVLLAWIELYGLPSWKELICIIIHDWGYWGKPNMDGQEGADHPFFAARLAKKYLGYDEYMLCLLHSRHLSYSMGLTPSRLCYADKLSLKYDPWWFYLPRAWSSGELLEYRRNAERNGFVSGEKTHREWFKWAYDVMVTIGLKQKADAMPYSN